MKSNTFLSATPEARGKLIAIAYQNLGARFRVMTDETESLNAMLSLARTMPTPSSFRMADGNIKWIYLWMRVMNCAWPC